MTTPRPRPLAALLLVAAVAPAAAAADPARVKVVLAGDSTVTDNAGWGAAFAKAVGPDAEVVNLARGGASSKSYRAIGLWKKVLDAKPAWVLVQFGHNDQPGKGPERETDPKTTFPENLRRFVDQALAAGAKPVLVTPLARRVYENGKIRPDQAAYAAATRAVAAEKGVPLVDLYARSVEELERLGPDKVVGYNAASKDPKTVDRTHLSPEGAAATTALVVAELKTAAPDLAKLLK